MLHLVTSGKTVNAAQTSTECSERQWSPLYILCHKVIAGQLYVYSRSSSGIPRSGKLADIRYNRHNTAYINV